MFPHLAQECSVGGWGGDNTVVKHLITEASGDVVIDPGVSGGGGNDLLKVDGSQHITGTLRIGDETITSGTHSDAQLFVDGKVAAKSCIVTINNWSDDVFYDGYTLRTPQELSAYIKDNKHLPGVPSECEVLENGVSVGEMDGMLLRKIEELTLYMLAQEKQIAELKELLNKK